MRESRSREKGNGLKNEASEPPPLVTGLPAAAACVQSGSPHRGAAVQRQPQLKLLLLSGGGAGPQAFRKRYFPEATHAQWNNWRWQIRNRVTSMEALSRFLDLSENEKVAFAHASGKLPLSITPYYLGLLDPHDAEQPLRRTMVPTFQESICSPGESSDPLSESGHTVLPGLVHRYPDRVLLLATDFCSAYCRYCTRSRLVGLAEHGQHVGRRGLERALAYIEANKEVRDVLISGGDPLTMSDERLSWLLGRLRTFSHVEIVRIGTKTPAVLPQRITPALTRMLKRYHPLFMSLHFTHPDELTPETARACNRLADAGIPLGSQTVLLAGVNDSVDTMRALMQGLLKMRVRPYYLYQCDPISGSAQFRTPVDKGLEIISGLRGHTSGYAIPTYVIDAPGGGGKVALYPNSVAGRRGDDLLLTNYAGQTYSYPDCGPGRLH